MNIDNKYYSADILLFDIRDKHLFDKRFEESVNGVIIYFDAEEVILIYFDNNIIKMLIILKGNQF